MTVIRKCLHKIGYIINFTFENMKGDVYERKSKMV